MPLKSLKGERGTHKNTICRNTGSKLSQTDEIHRTKKLNELQTQETKKTRPKDTTARQEENLKKQTGENDISWRVKNDKRLLVGNNANQETVE